MNIIKTATTSIRFKISGPATVRVSPFDGDTYKKVQHILWSTNIAFNSWQLKSDRSFRIEDINSDLDAAGHVFRNVKIIFKSSTLSRWHSSKLL